MSRKKLPMVGLYIRHKRRKGKPLEHVGDCPAFLFNMLFAAKAVAESYNVPDSWVEYGDAREQKRKEKA